MDISESFEEKNLPLFCDDVFRSLSTNISDYDQGKHEPHLFLYELTVNAKCTHFSPEMEKTVHTFAYLFRKKCRSEYCRRSPIMKSRMSFGKYILKHTILEDNYYLRLLAWIGFVYEITATCYFKGKYYYVARSRECLQKSMNIEHFKNEEHWKKFSETANRIALFYDPLIKSICHPLDENDILTPFQYALKETLRLNRYKFNMTKLMMFRDSANPKQYSKLKCLWKYNPQQIWFGHTVLRKNKSSKKYRMSSKKISTVSESVPSASEAQRYPDVLMDDVMCGPSISSAACNSNVSGCGASDDKEYLTDDGYKYLVFIISERYRSSLKKDGREYGNRKYFKIYSLADERLDQDENLNSILENYIKAGNIKEISEELLVVGLREDNINSGHQIIVVDSSSEVEDDDEFDSCQRSIIDGVLRNWKEFSLDDVKMMHLALKSSFSTHGETKRKLAFSKSSKLLEPHLKTPEQQQRGSHKAKNKHRFSGE